EVRQITADFGFRTSIKEEGRLFNPNFGGGSLLDVGVYPVALAHWILGAPSQIKAIANLGETGVDEQGAWIFAYPGGQLAMMSSAIRTDSQQEARIAGTEGIMRIPDWWHARSFNLVLKSEPDKEKVVVPPFEGNGYNYEAAEVATCLRAGK